MNRARNGQCVFYGVPGNTHNPGPLPAKPSDPLVFLSGAAVSTCQRRGWLDEEHNLTPAGRKALQGHDRD
jgi:hypothetical protein